MHTCFLYIIYSKGKFVMLLHTVRVYKPIHRGFNQTPKPKTLTPHTPSLSVVRAKMADAPSSVKKVKNLLFSGTANSVETVKSFFNSQVYDEEKWALNMVLFRSFKFQFKIYVFLLSLEFSISQNVLSVVSRIGQRPFYRLYCIIKAFRSALCLVAEIFFSFTATEYKVSIL